MIMEYSFLFPMVQNLYKSTKNTSYSWQKSGLFLWYTVYISSLYTIVLSARLVSKRGEFLDNLCLNLHYNNSAMLIGLQCMPTFYVSQ